MQFYAPKNFKSGRLIAGRYSIRDVVVLVAGFSLSLLCEIFAVGVLDVKSVPIVILIMFPAVFAYAITTPFGVYHNVYYMLLTIRKYSSIRKNYTWEGVYKHDTEN